MTLTRVTGTVAAVRDSVKRFVGFLALLLISASSRRRAVRPEAVRERAGSAPARHSCEASEECRRGTVRAYDEHAPLIAHDMSVGGVARPWFFPTGDDQYKIRCRLRATAYYGADPRRIGDVLDDQEHTAYLTLTDPPRHEGCAS